METKTKGKKLNMRISVKNIIKNHIGKYEVNFISDFGECKGNWCVGEPKIKDYFVELDIPKVTVDGVKIPQNKKCILRLEEPYVLIQGKLEGYEEDGLATIRLQDSIICFETSYDDQFQNLINKLVQIRVKNIDLYDEKII